MYCFTRMLQSFQAFKIRKQILNPDINPDWYPYVLAFYLLHCPSKAYRGELPSCLGQFYPVFVMCPYSGELPIKISYTLMAIFLNLTLTYFKTLKPVLLVKKSTQTKLTAFLA